MTRNKQAKKLPLALAIALSMGGITGGALAHDMAEARQESQITTTYALSPLLRTSDIKVEVANGTAVLTGKVDEDINKDLAGEIALGVNGIDDVDNQIEVVADYEAVAETGDRSYGDIVSDASITAAVKSKLLWNRDTQGLASNVETKAGTVTLQGTAKNAASRELAGALALNTPGVVSVDNRLLVDESTPTPGEKVRETTDEIGQDFSDGWITAKVKSTLMYSSSVNSSRIEVTTKDGVVSLTGVLNSESERALAVELASNIKGVSRVDSKNLSHL